MADQRIMMTGEELARFAIEAAEDRQNAVITSAQMMIRARIEHTSWASDARLLRLVIADLEKLRVQSEHDPEG